MKTITFMEMVELSFSDEYREYVKKDYSKFINQKYMDDYFINALVDNSITFEDFLDDMGYKLAF